MHAAVPYLVVVMEGWVPTHPTIVRHVKSIIRIINTTPSQLCLRTIIWPFCVAGCLAQEEQEHAFRDAVSDMEPFQAFGTVKQALKIMERVWRLQKRLDQDSWALYYCFEAGFCSFDVQTNP